MIEARGLNPGGRVGNYTLVQKLRDGGMASLFLAKRTGVHGFTRPVAIKVVHAHLSGQEEFMQMFVDEALLSSHLSHPNIVHVEEFGELPDGRCFLAMEYIDGCSLSEWTRLMRKQAGGADHRLVTHIGIRVAEALEAAHTALDANGQSLGVVHRDVSPGNILLSRRGHIKVVDFGIAKSSLRSEDTAETLKGKLRYMSPEQARGAFIDVRTDIYSLGLVIWELLVGERVFSAKRDMALLEEVQNPAITAPSEHVEGIPPELDAVLLKALSPSVEGRYATSREFARALREAVPAASSVEAADVAALVDTIPLRNVDRSTMTGTGPDSEISRTAPTHSGLVDISSGTEVPLGVPTGFPVSMAEEEVDPSDAFEALSGPIAVEDGGAAKSSSPSKRYVLVFATLALLGLGALAVLQTKNDEVHPSGSPPDAVVANGPANGRPSTVAPATSPEPRRIPMVAAQPMRMDAVALPPRSTWGMAAAPMTTMSRMWEPPVRGSQGPSNAMDASMRASMVEANADTVVSADSATAVVTPMTALEAPTDSASVLPVSPVPPAADPELEQVLPHELEEPAPSQVRVESGTRMRAPLVD